MGDPPALLGRQQQRDIDDAIHYLKELRSKDNGMIFKKISEYRPSVPQVADKLFESRFNQIWEKVYGRS